MNRLRLPAVDQKVVVGGIGVVQQFFVPNELGGLVSGDFYRAGEKQVIAE